MQLEGHEIPQELIEQLVLTQLYKEDYVPVIRQYLGNKPPIKTSDADKIYRKIIESPEFEQAKKTTIEIEKDSLIEDDLGTIMLQYNNLLKKAQREGKYEVAARILAEIRKIKAIDNEQMKFEIVFKIEEPKDKDEVK